MRSLRVCLRGGVWSVWFAEEKENEGDFVKKEQQEGVTWKSGAGRKE